MRFIEITEALAKHHGVKPENIMLGAGSGEILDVTCDALLEGEGGDKKIVGAEPSYDVLYQHAAVAEAGVVGLPHPLKGEQVRACVALRPGTAATAAELIAFCKERLTPYKAPVDVAFFPTLPKGPSGKMLRRELRVLLGGAG